MDASVLGSLLLQSNLASLPVASGDSLVVSRDMESLNPVITCILIENGDRRPHISVSLFHTTYLSWRGLTGS